MVQLKTFLCGLYLLYCEMEMLRMLLSDSDDHGDIQHVNTHSELKGRKPAFRSSGRVKPSRLSEGMC